MPVQVKKRRTRRMSAFDLLSGIKAEIVATPQSYDQGTYCARTGGKGICNTVACVAGHIVWAVDGKRKMFQLDAEPGGFEVARRAAEILGMQPSQTNAFFQGSALSGAAARFNLAPQMTSRSGVLDYALVGALHIGAFQRENAEHLQKRIVSVRR